VECLECAVNLVRERLMINSNNMVRKYWGNGEKRRKKEVIQILWNSYSFILIVHTCLFLGSPGRGNTCLCLSPGTTIVIPLLVPALS
jgi:hypothetical protein